MSRPTCATWPFGWRPCPTTERCQGIDSAAVPPRMTAPLLIIAAAQFLLARSHTGIALRQLGERPLLGVGKHQAPPFLVPQDPVFGNQILITQQQFLVDRAGYIGQDSRPIHKLLPMHRATRTGIVRCAGMPDKGAPGLLSTAT